MKEILIDEEIMDKEKIVCERRMDEGLCTLIRGGEKRVIEHENDSVDYRIRRLTPKECWRLMGFSDDDFDKAQSAGISNTQLYKQAGNSIVVDVLYYIYRNLYKAMPYLFDDLKVGSYFSGIGAFETALDRLFDEINDENFTISSQTLCEGGETN